jgi:asparagine synthase (glutamine-hydrolysing)
MCGILAILSGGEPVDASKLAAGSRSLEHRGPDGTSHWIAPHGGIGLAQTRLSIIDLSDFAGPIANEDESLRVVVNGEFYGFEQIREGLQRRGHRFRTKCDSEIVLHLYEEYGEACLEHLRGEFAFVLWDERKNALFAARDRFGIKPLFFAESQGVVYLASEVAALFASGLPAAWDRESVFQNLFLCLGQDRSLFKGVRQVPPGHVLTVRSRGAPSLRRYWDLNYPRVQRSGHPRDGREVIEEVRDRVTESIRIRLRSDVPLGCYLSGGLDSSSVLGVARTLSPEPVPAFTVAFDHPDFDESATAAGTAAHLGVPFVAVPVTDTDIADHFPDAVSAGEMVHYNGHGAARYLLSRAVRRAGYKAVLAGEGADELFSGYDFAQTALERSGNHRGRLSSGLRLLKGVLRRRTTAEQRIAATSPWLGRLCRAVSLPPSMTDSLADKLALLRGLLSPDFKREFQSHDPYATLIRQLHVVSVLRGRAPVHQVLYIWMKSLFPNYVLGADRLDMAHAVEVRLPFLDHKLFEFARNIPPELLLKDGRRKYALRESMKGFVTDSVYSGRKQPFFAPPSALGRGNRLQTLLCDYLAGPNFSLPFFDMRNVRKLADEAAGKRDPSARASLDPMLFMLASMRILHDRYRL